MKKYEIIFSRSYEVTEKEIKKVLGRSPQSQKEITETCEFIARLMFFEFMDWEGPSGYTFFDQENFIKGFNTKTRLI